MQFYRAYARLPAANCGEGITTSASLGAPDVQKTQEQFFAYINTLVMLGLKVMVLPAQPEYPDGHFIEDTAVIMPEMAVITPMGSPSRRGEADGIVAELDRERPLRRMSRSGNMDGGDVLLVEKRFFIGLTSRTDEAAISEFARWVEPLGYRVRAVEIADGLHLKSVINYIGGNRLLLTEAYGNHPAFTGFTPIIIPGEEAYAANTLWINNTLITPAGYGHTLRQLQKQELPVIVLDTGEFKKMDGGLTCLSLRF
ncbi:arginine deiminase-related protein [Sodalis sp. dw_96]|uniref:dimethylarginine dimethylaminohydrolase family protein n=1 Tax=Sodalis sp. dw_96 TaxID=2719794 RepID=UPI001BD5E6FA